MKISNFGVRLQIDGLNLDRLFAKVIQKYEIYDVCRDKYDSITLSLSHKNYQNLLSNIDASCYTITVLDSFLIKAKNTLLRSIGILASFIVMIVAFLLCCPFIFFININCSDDNLKQVVYETLSDKYLYKKFDVCDIENLQSELSGSISDISLLSISKLGNTLMVNIKPTEKVDTMYEPIYAPYNLMILDMTVYQGTTAYKSGDIVQSGQVIVEPYVLVDGDKHYVEPNADILAKVWVVGISEFHEKTTDTVRTGSVITNVSYSVMKFNIGGKKQNVDFESYDTEELSYYVSDMFVPIKISKSIYYETTTIETTHIFDNEKQYYIDLSRKDAYNKLNGNENTSEKVDIYDISGTKYIKTTLEFDIKVSNKK